MSKTIISCYKCGKKMRVPTDKHVRFNCVNCQESIEVKNGLIFTPITIVKEGKSTESSTSRRFKEKLAKEEREIERKGKQRRTAIIAGIVFSFIAFVAYLIMTQEKRDFVKISENPTISGLTRFLRHHPNGEYKFDAITLKDSLLYLEAKETQRLGKELRGISDCEKLRTIKPKLTVNYIEESHADLEQCLWDNVQEKRDFEAIEAYQDVFPNGKYKDSIALAHAQVWEHLYEKYSLRIKEKEISKEAQNFVKALLNYAERSKEMRMHIAFQSTVNLKDWNDYTKKERDLVDMMTSFSNSSSKTDYPLPSVSIPPPIKHNFMNIGSHAQREIVLAFQERLDSVFLPGMFTVVESVSKATHRERPLINVRYKIETLAEKIEGGEFPSLYVHTEGFNPQNISIGDDGKTVIEPSGKFLGYLLATGINWDVEFSIPGRPEKVNLTSYSRPNSHFSNIGGPSRVNNSSVYQKMLSSAFHNYAEEIADEIGL